MATQTVAGAQAEAIKAPLQDMGHKTYEAMSAYAEASQRVLNELVNLSSAAMQETVRVYGELNAAALNAARTVPAFPFMPSFDDVAKDPAAGVRQGAVAAGEAPQRFMKLLDNNTQIMGQGAQRFQAAAERSGREIRDAVTSYFNRIGQIYGGK